MFSIYYILVIDKTFDRWKSVKYDRKKSIKCHSAIRATGARFLG